MTYSTAGCVSMAHFTFLTSIRKGMFFQTVAASGALAHFFNRSSSSTGGTHRHTDRASQGSAAVYPGADQAARNLRRPGGDRHRERAAVQELKESLEQQTATSEILGVIASSPTDIQPVLDVVAQNAARLCDANDAQIYRVEGESGEKLQAMETYPSILPSARHDL